MTTHPTTPGPARSWQWIVGAGVALAAALLALASPRSGDPSRPPEPGPYTAADLSVEVLPAPNGTFGYAVRMDGRVIVHQPHRPALPGAEGFTTQDHARKVGELVVHKLRSNILPPAVTVAELDSLGALLGSRLRKGSREVTDR